MPTAPCVASHMASLKSNKLPECLMCRSPHPLHVPGLSSLNHLFLSFFYKSIFVLSYFSLVVTYSFTFSITLSWCFSIILCSRFIVCFSYIWQQRASKFAVCHHSTEWEECNVRKKTPYFQNSSLLLLISITGAWPMYLQGSSAIISYLKIPALIIAIKGTLKK